MVPFSAHKKCCLDYSDQIRADKAAEHESCSSQLTLPKIRIERIFKIVEFLILKCRNNIPESITNFTPINAKPRAIGVGLV